MGDGIAFADIDASRVVCIRGGCPDLANFVVAGGFVLVCLSWVRVARTLCSPRRYYSIVLPETALELRENKTAYDAFAQLGSRKMTDWNRRV